MSVQAFSHLGICVSDPSRSLAFYRDALGFAERHRLPVRGADAERLLDLADVRLDAIYLERDGAVVELLHFASPGEVEAETPRPMNRPGFTHLSLRVSDLDAVIADVERHGGSVLRETETRRPEIGMAVVFVLDPDGARIELLQAPGDPHTLPGA